MMYDDEQHPSGDEIVEQHWPYDGPHGWDVSQSAATAIERLTRYLNNATQSSSGVPYAATVGNVTRELHAATELQQQLLNQLARRLEAVADDPELYNAFDRDQPAHDVALAAADRLRAAQSPRAAYAAALAEASSLAGRLSGGTDTVNTTTL